MFPYPDLPSLHLGPVEITAFGVCLAIGIMVGERATHARAAALGIDPQPVRDAIMVVVLSGIVVAHLFAVIVYQRDFSFARIIDFRRGLSSFGGFLGALGGFLVWAHRQKKRAKNKLKLLPLADAILFGLAPGWTFGRIGCYTAHDHPGRLTDSFLGVPYPNGVRYDLGLLEAMVSLAMTLLFLALYRQKPRAGTFAALFLLIYGPIRFGFDFIRATDLPGSDVRYAGLTPAQWGCLLVVLGGLLLARAVWKGRDARQVA